MTKVRSPKLGEWTFSTGRRPHTVTAYERKERGNEVWVRFGGRRVKISDNIRDHAGYIAPELEASVIARAAEVQVAFAAGRDAFADAHVAETAPTLRGAFDAALTLITGLYATTTPQWHDMRTLADDICDVLTSALNREPLVADITSHTARVLWRGIADDFAKGRMRTIKNKSRTRTIRWGGLRMAERAVDFLFRAVAFAYTEEKDAPKPPKKWKQSLQTDWNKQVGRANSGGKPTHSAEELKRMFLHLERADARLQLMLELGAEARLGQVARCTRAALSLDGGALDYGRLIIPGEDKKKGTEVDLTREQHEFIRDIMNTGYLSELEQYFTRGEILDYPLFPGSRLKNGVVRARISEDERSGKNVVVVPKAVSRDGVRGWFHAFEKALDIPHVARRGWYGIRRKAADMAEDSVPDARALNLVTGHADSKTRRGYQSVTREVRLLAIQARQAIRNRPEVVPQLVPTPKDLVQVEKTKRPNQL